LANFIRAVLQERDSVSDTNLETETTSSPAFLNMPVVLFTSVLGVMGLGLAWREANYTFGVPGFIGETIIGFGAGLYIAILTLYILKIINARDRVRAELKDDVSINYLPTITIGLMLVGIGAGPHLPIVGEALWAIGAIGNIIMTLYVVAGFWFVHDHKLERVTPAWFIPVIGNIVAPIGGSQFLYIDVSWMLYGISIFFWIILTTIVFNRLMFHEPMAAAARPTMFILLAPPSLAFTAYVLLNGGYVDYFGQMLFGIALLTALMLATRVKDYLKLPFGLSWWAFTFPMDALTIAALLYHQHIFSPLTAALSILCLAITTIVVTIVTFKTVVAASKGEILRPR